MEKDTIEQKIMYAANPFKEEEAGEVLLIGNQEVVNQLSVNGRTVFKYITRYLDRLNRKTCLPVNTICYREFNLYDQTFATRIRRGIRDLIKANVIAYTKEKDFYWVNKNIIWKQ